MFLVQGGSSPAARHGGAIGERRRAERIRRPDHPGSPPGDRRQHPISPAPHTLIRTIPLQRQETLPRAPFRRNADLRRGTARQFDRPTGRRAGPVRRHPRGGSAVSRHRRRRPRPTVRTPRRATGSDFSQPGPAGPPSRRLGELSGLTGFTRPSTSHALRLHTSLGFTRPSASHVPRLHTPFGFTRDNRRPAFRLPAGGLPEYSPAAGYFCFCFCFFFALRFCTSQEDHSPRCRCDRACLSCCVLECLGCLVGVVGVQQDLLCREDREPDGAVVQV